MLRLVGPSLTLFACVVSLGCGNGRAAPPPPMETPPLAPPEDEDRFAREGETPLANQHAAPDLEPATVAAPEPTTESVVTMEPPRRPPMIDGMGPPHGGEDDSDELLEAAGLE